jgi:CheY-like chemotaxis protein
MEGTQFGSGKTALVVDDQPDFCLMLAALLESFGFRAICANDGHQAVARLDQGGVDIILTDLFMPDMDGIELIRKVHECGDPAPVIAFTGDPHYAAHSVGAAAASLGARAVLMKPFSRDQLASAIGFCSTTKAPASAPT